MYGTNDSYVDKGREGTATDSREVPREEPRETSSTRSARRAAEPILMTEPRWAPGEKKRPSAKTRTNSSKSTSRRARESREGQEGETCRSLCKLEESGSRRPRRFAELGRPNGCHPNPARTQQRTRRSHPSRSARRAGKRNRRSNHRSDSSWAGRYPIRESSRKKGSRSHRAEHGSRGLARVAPRNAVHSRARRERQGEAEDSRHFRLPMRSARAGQKQLGIPLVTFRRRGRTSTLCVDGAGRK